MCVVGRLHDGRLCGGRREAPGRVSARRAPSPVGETLGAGDIGGDFFRVVAMVGLEMTWSGGWLLKLGALWWVCCAGCELAMARIVGGFAGVMVGVLLGGLVGRNVPVMCDRGQRGRRVGGVENLLVPLAVGVDPGPVLPLSRRAVRAHRVPPDPGRRVQRRDAVHGAVPDLAVHALHCKVRGAGGRGGRAGG